MNYESGFSIFGIEPALVNLASIQIYDHSDIEVYVDKKTLFRSFQSPSLSGMARSPYSSASQA